MLTNTTTKLKVLHVAPMPPPLGGMVSYVQGLLGSDVSKLVNVRVVRLEYLGKERFDGLLRVIINFLNAIILTSVFLWETLRWRPDIVHIQTNSGFGFYEKSWIAFLAKVMGRKTLMHVHGGNFRQFFNKSPRIMQRFIRWCGKFNDRIVTASPQMRDTWLYIGLPDHKVVQINNAVDIPIVENVYQHDSEIVILFLTRIVLAKGIIELIDAIRILRGSISNIYLRIVGAEELESHLVKEHINSLGTPDYILYVGPVTEAEKHTEYSKADIFAFPTHVEDQSYAVMEAMSYGLPCAASNVGGIPSLIQNGKNGLLFSPRDVQSLIGALNELIQNSELRTQLGVAARKTIENQFSWKRAATEIYDLYRQMMMNNANRCD